MNRFLLVTANNNETTALLENRSFFNYNSNERSSDLTDDSFYNTGIIGKYEVIHFELQDQGSVKKGASLLSIDKAIRYWKPDAVILIGIAFGKDNEEKSEPRQHIGDVLVSTMVQDYESGKIINGEFQSDGPKPESGKTLLSVFKNYSKSWDYKICSRKVQCEFGLLLSGDKVVDDPELKKMLFNAYPRAIGGEMEGRGAYAACRNNRLEEWIIIKAICDWGENKEDPNKENNQITASRAAISLLKHVLSEEKAFDKLPKQNGRPDLHLAVIQKKTKTQEYTFTENEKKEDVNVQKYSDSVCQKFLQNNIYKYRKEVFEDREDFKNKRPFVNRNIDTSPNIQLISRNTLTPSHDDERYKMIDDKISINNILPKGILSKHKFVGRKEYFGKIDKAFEESRFVVLWTSVGGLGKTEIAKKYVERERKKGVTVCFLTYNEDLMSTINNLKFSDYKSKKGMPTQKKYELFIKRLSEFKEKLLIVIDNFDFNIHQEDNVGVEKLKAEIEVFNKITDPNEGEYCLIVTSRIDYREDNRVYDIEVIPLDDNAAMYLFKNVYTNNRPEECLISENNIQSILTAINNHTLGIVLIAKLLHEGGITANDLLTRLENNIMKMGYDVKIPSSYSNDNKLLEEHLKVIFDVSNLSTEDKLIMMNMSLVPVDGMPKALFVEWIGFDDTINKINVLIKKGWIQESADGQTIFLHPLISDIIAVETELNCVDCGNYIKNLVKDIKEKKENTVKEHNDALRFIKSIFKRIDDIKEAEKTDIIAKLCTAAGDIFIKLAEYKEAKNFHEKAFNINKTFYKDDSNPNIITAYREYGYAFYRLNKYDESIEKLKRHLELCKQNYGEIHISTATAYNYFAAVNYRTGNFNGALKCINKAIRIRESELGEHYETAELYNNKAILLDSLKKHDEALKYCEKAKRICIDQCDATDPNIASTFNNEGGIYYHKAKCETDPEKALKFYKKSLELNEESLKRRIINYGEKHTSIATSYSNIALLHCCEREYGKAIENNEKAKKIREEIFSDDNTAKAISLNNIGVVHYQLSKCKNKKAVAEKQYEEPESCFKEALEIFKHILKDGHPYIKTLNNNLEYLNEFKKTGGCSGNIKPIYYSNYLLYSNEPKNKKT